MSRSGWLSLTALSSTTCRCDPTSVHICKWKNGQINTWAAETLTSQHKDALQRYLIENYAHHTNPTLNGLTRNLLGKSCPNSINGLIPWPCLSLEMLHNSQNASKRQTYTPNPQPDWYKNRFRQKHIEHTSKNHEESAFISDGKAIKIEIKEELNTW